MKIKTKVVLKSLQFLMLLPFSIWMWIVIINLLAQIDLVAAMIGFTVLIFFTAFYGNGEFSK